MIKYIIAILFVSLFLSSLSCSKEDKPDFLTFQFDKQATIIIKNVHQKNKPSILGRYISLLPPDYIRNYVTADLTADSNEFTLNYKLSTPSQTDLIIGNQQLHVFLVPGDTLYLAIDLSDSTKFFESIKFEGKYAEVNNYKLKRFKVLGEKFEQKCAKLSNSQLQIRELQNSIDSISAIETDYLNNYNKNNPLPEWYLNFERNEVFYTSAWAKIGNTEPVEYDNILNDIKINNADALICPNYYGFLNIYFQKYFLKEMLQMDISVRKKILALKYLQAADSLLSGEIEEVFKAYIIASFIIDFGMYDLAATIINEEKDKMSNAKYINYLEEYLKDRITLKTGDKAPGFYLLDEKNGYKSLSDFKESVLLLNFWSPGCTPCIQEIPFEKKLVADLKNKNFHLINICFLATEENWRKAINKLGMEGINLFADENWQKQLIERYKILSFPHYTLIDRNGNIISNYPKKPSEGVLEDILKLINN